MKVVDDIFYEVEGKVSGVSCLVNLTKGHDVFSCTDDL